MGHVLLCAKCLQDVLCYYNMKEEHDIQQMLKKLILLYPCGRIPSEILKGVFKDKQVADKIIGLMIDCQEHSPT